MRCSTICRQFSFSLFAIVNFIFTVTYFVLIFIYNSLFLPLSLLDRVFLCSYYTALAVFFLDFFPILLYALFNSKWNASLCLGVAQPSVFPFLIIYIKYQTKIKSVCYTTASAAALLSSYSLSSSLFRVLMLWDAVANSEIFPEAFFVLFPFYSFMNCSFCVCFWIEQIFFSTLRIAYFPLWSILWRI